ncbi:Protein of unknown function [Propionibacterium freudenreichii]|nr:Protein of unknown function [Propionibacterium freudenreichii]
MSRAFAHLS